MSMKARMSGWSTRMMPMLAPRRNAPCWMASVTPESIFRKDSGPSVVPPEERTIEPLGRSRDRSMPVPPPARCTRAICRAVAMMSSIESSSGKHEARREHAEASARVHQRGRIGQKAAAGHQAIELVLDPLSTPRRWRPRSARPRRQRWPPVETARPAFQRLGRRRPAAGSGLRGRSLRWRLSFGSSRVRLVMRIEIRW